MTKRLGGEVIQQSALVTANNDVERKQRCRTKTNVDRKRRHQTTNKETWEGGKYNNTTISISPLVMSWTLSAVQSFDVERKRRHQTLTTPSETRERGAILKYNNQHKSFGWEFGGEPMNNDDEVKQRCTTTGVQF